MYSMKTVKDRITAGELKRAGFFLPAVLVRRIRYAAKAERMTVSEWATAVFTAALKSKRALGKDRG
jgi:hypothetical protein